ncbi:MAG: hypothetical protein ABFR47_08680 [Verrucomicrobiota bacterium]
MAGSGQVSPRSFYRAFFMWGGLSSLPEVAKGTCFHPVFQGLDRPVRFRFPAWKPKGNVLYRRHPGGPVDGVAQGLIRRRAGTV